MSVVQQKYEELIDAMPVHVKVARAAQMFAWSRDWIIHERDDVHEKPDST